MEQKIELLAGVRSDQGQEVSELKSVFSQFLHVRLDDSDYKRSMSAINILSQSPTFRWDVTVKARLRPNSTTQKNWQSWATLLQLYSVLHPVSSSVFSSTCSSFSSMMTDSSHHGSTDGKAPGQNLQLERCYALNSLECVQRPSVYASSLVNNISWPLSI